MDATIATWMPESRTVPEAIAQWAAATPDAPALFGIRGDCISHAEVQMRIEDFARQLSALGVMRGDRVVLALPNGVEAAIAGLATLRTAVGVPVNLSQPLAEADSILAAVSPQVVIVAQGAETAFREAALRASIPVVALDAGAVLHLDMRFPMIPAEAPLMPAPDDLAMILLTSGTTDVPRRVPATHGNVLATCSARVQARRLSPRDRGLTTAPAYFVLGLARIIESLISGGSAIVATAAEMVAFPETIRKLEPTWAWISPAVLETVLEAARENPTYGKWPLRFVRSGGAHVSPDLIERAQAVWGAPLLSGYGTTETLGYIAAEESPETIPRKPGSVGLIRPGFEVKIRNADGQPLRAGMVGEITVRGPNVFSGYLGEPEATRAAFFPDGWYRTGDVGYVDDEGYLFVTGRLREMINRGGEKISPIEIDEVLRAHPDIADAAAFAVPDPRLGEDIAAAIVLRSEGALDKRAVRRWAAGRVSPHKIPRRIWFVDEIPRTGSGKVQRSVLTDQYRSHGK